MSSDPSESQNIKEHLEEAKILSLSEVSDEPVMRFFSYTHLPEHLQAVSRPFCELAEKMVRLIPRNPERTIMLRKLLESKDSAVRAIL